MKHSNSELFYSHLKQVPNVAHFDREIIIFMDSSIMTISKRTSSIYQGCEVITVNELSIYHIFI